MRAAYVASIALLSPFGVASATALPKVQELGAPITAAQAVRMDCNESRCLDTRTGAYTQSSCDYRGCYPIGGVVGRLNRYGQEIGRGRNYGRWSCNTSRCIDTRTGAYTQSTCDYNGCRPLGGVRGYAD